MSGERENSIEQPEELGNDGLTRNEREAMEAYFAIHEEAVASSEKVDYQPTLVEFEQMFTEFYQAHSVEALMAITEFISVEDIRSNPIREPARLALIPITEKLNFLQEQTNIPDEKLQELKDKYHQLWKAVGVVRDSRVVHE